MIHNRMSSSDESFAYTNIIGEARTAATYHSVRRRERTVLRQLSTLGQTVPRYDAYLLPRFGLNSSVFLSTTCIF